MAQRVEAGRRFGRIPSPRCKEVPMFRNRSRIGSRSLAVLAIVVSVGFTGCAAAAGGSSSRAPSSAPEPEPIDLASFTVPHADRPTLMILDFDYSAVASNLTSDEGEGLASLIRALRDQPDGRDRNESNLGAGIADLILTQMLEAGQFRVLERRQLQTLMAEQDLSSSDRAAPTEASQVEQARILGAQYALVGSVTRLGSEETNRGIGLGGRSLGGLGAIGRRSRDTVVGLTARIVDTSTGEVLLSVSGEGNSDRGGGFALGGGAGGNGLAIGSSTSNVRETAIGEATDGAVLTLVGQMAERWERLW